LYLDFSADFSTFHIPLEAKALSSDSIRASKKKYPLSSGWGNPPAGVDISFFDVAFRIWFGAEVGALNNH